MADSVFLAELAASAHSLRRRLAPWVAGEWYLYHCRAYEYKTYKHLVTAKSKGWVHKLAYFRGHGPPQRWKSSITIYKYYMNNFCCLFSSVADVGGNMGLFLGCSLLTLCEFVDLIVIMCLRCWRKRRTVDLKTDPYQWRIILLIQKLLNDSTGNKYLRLWIEENTESENANTNQFSLMIKLFEYLSCLRTENAIHINWSMFFYIFIW